MPFLVTTIANDIAISWIKGRTWNCISSCSSAFGIVAFGFGFSPSSGLAGIFPFAFLRLSFLPLSFRLAFTFLWLVEEGDRNDDWVKVSSNSRLIQCVSSSAIIDDCSCVLFLVASVLVVKFVAFFCGAIHFASAVVNEGSGSVIPW